MTGRFIAQRENVLFLGLPGIGGATAQAIGRAAILEGTGAVVSRTSDSGCDLGEEQRWYDNRVSRFWITDGSCKLCP